MTDSQREERKKVIKAQMKRLADKVVLTTNEMKKFSPKKLSIRKNAFAPRPSFFKNWCDMARISLICTRKKIYRLKAELERL